MRSELFRIPVELGGLPFLGLGLLLALWVLGFAATLVWNWKRGAKGEQLWGYLTPAALGAAAILFAPRFFPEGLPIRGYGVMLLIAISTRLAMAVHRARRHGVHPDTVLSLAFWLFVLGIAGARLFFVIEYWEVRFAGQTLGATIVDVLRFTEGGLVVYGSLIGAAVAFVWFTLRHKLPMLAMADVLAPSLAAGLALGRLGCLLNGCCYGGQCELPWAVTFPKDSPPFMDQLIHGELHGARVFVLPAPMKDPRPRLASADQLADAPIVESINAQRVQNINDAAAAFSRAYATASPVTIETTDGQQTETPAADRTRSLPVHPTQVYSAINAGLLSWLLWSWFPHRRRDGEVALLMLTIYPVSRFLLEIIRTDEQAIFGTGLSISQNVSVALLAAAAVGWLILLRQPAGSKLVELPPGDFGGQARTSPAGAA